MRMMRRWVGTFGADRRSILVVTEWKLACRHQHHCFLGVHHCIGAEQTPASLFLGVHHWCSVQHTRNTVLCTCVVKITLLVWCAMPAQCSVRYNAEQSSGCTGAVYSFGESQISCSLGLSKCEGFRRNLCMKAGPRSTL